MPRFHHDCEKCLYIATRYFPGERMGDIYKCKGSIIIRWSDDGPDYTSMNVEILKSFISRGDDLTPSMRDLVLAVLTDYIEF